MKLYTSMKYIGAAVAAMSLSIGASFTMAVPVDFTDSDVKGSYYGLVYDSDMTTPVGSLNLKVSKKGSFSGRLTSSSRSKVSSMKGKMMDDGSYSGQQRNTEGVTCDADLQIMMAGSGYYRITGVLTSPDTTKQYFELRRAVYSKSSPTTLADRYTMVVPSVTTDAADIPAGNGVAYGQVKTNGEIWLKGYSNAGNKFSFSGVVLEGDLVSFYTEPKNRDIEALLGVLAFEDIVAVSDLDGTLYHTQQVSTKGGYYPDGYSQMLPSFGSRYVKPASSEFPVDAGFDFALESNAVASFTGGAYDMTSYIFTWEPSGSMKAPTLPLYTTSGKMKNKTGYFSGKYNVYDADDNFLKTKSSFRGVAIQKQNILSGQVVTSDVSGRYVIEYNDTGELAPTSFITPRIEYASAGAYSYVVEVFVDGPWQVVLPEGKDWIDVDITSGDGNGEVVVTVESNPTAENRSANLKIAGLKHQLKQDPGEDVVEGEPNSGVTISPTTYLVTDWLGGETYTIDVVSTGDWTVSVPVGASWIQAIPASGTGDGTVTVTVGTNPFFFTRTGTVLIGDAIHRVSQWP